MLPAAATSSVPPSHTWLLFTVCFVHCSGYMAVAALHRDIGQSTTDTAQLSSYHLVQLKWRPDKGLKSLTDNYSTSIPAGHSANIMYHTARKDSHYCVHDMCMCTGGWTRMHHHTPLHACPLQTLRAALCHPPCLHPKVGTPTQAIVLFEDHIIFSACLVLPSSHWPCHAVPGLTLQTQITLHHIIAAF